MNHGSPPDFIAAGTFLWNERGYFYSHPPDVDLLAPEALDSEDPWIVVAATLEHAKTGNHSPVKKLSKLVQLDSPNLVIHACLDILADAATDRDLPLLSRLMSHENFDIQERSCWAAMQAGSMLLVPSMLETWRRGQWRIRDTLCFLLSLLLEEHWPLDENLGPIANGASLPFEEFNELVSERMQVLQNRAGSASAPIWGGRIFGVRSFAERMVSLIPLVGKLAIAPAVFIPMRHKFEASTGIDCSAFFSGRDFQPRKALVTLADFLESDQASRYKEGIRYFFGHPLPAH
jgi:hypothetical protein